MQTSSLRPSQFGSSAKTSKTAWFAASLVVCLFAVVFAAFAQKGKEVRLGPEVMPDADTPVTVTDDGTSFILSNGYLTATINKRTGDMSSLKVHGLETQGYVSGHHAGYWEQNPAGAARMEAKVTIDPAANGGERAEVSVKGWSDGKNLNGTRGAGPGVGGPRPADAAGAAPASAGQDAPAAEDDVTAGARTAPAVQLPPGVPRNRGTATGPRPGAGPGGAGGGGRGPGLLVDMEIRYTLGRGEKGIYTYAIYTHAPSYGATQIGESRYGMKLNGGVFDWLSIDEQRNEAMPTGADWDKGTDLNMKEARRLTTGVKTGQVEHKYDYCADQFGTPAFGWSSTKQHVGIYFINPSVEFLSSGPNHFELTGHLDDGDGGDPTLLDYWRGSHYGGSILPIAAGENWNKVVGPVMIYVPTGPTPDAMFADAKRQATVEAGKWPYAWVNGVDFPKAAERSTVSGQMVLRDPQAPGANLPNLLVGLAYPDQTPVAAPTAQPAQAGQPGGRTPEAMTWQNDAKHYEFWTRGTADGKFTIPNVRAGTYELHAIADGVLGEYAKADVMVGAGGKVDLGKLEWKPVRYGKQLWQIGIPNRSASEFLNGNDHWHWGEYIAYAKLFPNDVNFTIGKSDFRKDWYIYQVPHDEELPDVLGKGKGRETPWKVNFTLAKAPAAGERGVLRLAIAGASARSIAVKVNGKDAGTVEGLVYNATINRDGVEGSWVEKDLSFDGSLLHAGANTLTLIVPAGGITSGVAYDVVRLELAPAQQAVATELR
jgi:rhamnogalacturonan endolyase